VAGGILIGVGLFSVVGVLGTTMAVAGIVPLAAGLFDICVFAPIFGVPFSGAKIRSMR
jgi:hypothetical protein